MAFGDGPCDESLHCAWNEFCESLKLAGERVFKDHNPSAPLQRADAFRFLTQNLGQAFDLGFETKDPRYPVIHSFCSPFRKLGGDAADFTYQQAWIDGNSVYRISGSKGSARFFNIAVQGKRPQTIPGTDWPSLHDPFGDIPETNLFGHQLKTDWDGTFELYIGGPQRGPNWLPTTADTRKLFIRQGFDRWDEQPGRFRIERIDMTSPKPVPTPDDMIEGMNWAGTFLTSLMEDWPDHPYRYSPGVVNHTRVNVFPGSERTDSDEKRGRAIAHMCWQLAGDESLIIEFDNHTRFWMLTNSGVFMNSMDYLYRPVSYTPSRVKVDSDDKVRVVVAHDDPGYHNWMDTQGFGAGNMTYRNLLTAEATQLRTRVVKRNALATVLPEDSATVTPEQRVEQMKERFNGIRKRFDL